MPHLNHCTQGFQRVSINLDDTCLDTPQAKDMFQKHVALARSEGWLDADWDATAPGNPWTPPAVPAPLPPFSCLDQIPISVKREGVCYGQCSALYGAKHAFVPSIVAAHSSCSEDSDSWLTLL